MAKRETRNPPKRTEFIVPSGSSPGRITSTHRQDSSLEIHHSRPLDFGCHSTWPASVVRSPFRSFLCSSRTPLHSSSNSRTAGMDRSCPPLGCYRRGPFFQLPRFRSNSSQCRGRAEKESSLFKHTSVKPSSKEDAPQDDFHPRNKEILFRRPVDGKDRFGKVLLVPRHSSMSSKVFSFSSQRAPNAMDIHAIRLRECHANYGSADGSGHPKTTEDGDRSCSLGGQSCSSSWKEFVCGQEAVSQSPQSFTQTGVLDKQRQDFSFGVQDSQVSGVSLVHQTLTCDDNIRQDSSDSSQSQEDSSSSLISSFSGVSHWDDSVRDPSAQRPLDSDSSSGFISSINCGEGQVGPAVSDSSVCSQGDSAPPESHSSLSSSSSLQSDI